VWPAAGPNDELDIENSSTRARVAPADELKQIPHGAHSHLAGRGRNHRQRRLDKRRSRRIGEADDREFIGNIHSARLRLAQHAESKNLTCREDCRGRVRGVEEPR
jgi:hypothetical protein